MSRRNRKRRKRTSQMETASAANHGAFGLTAPHGRVFRVSQNLDGIRQTVFDKLNLKKLKSLLRAADDGDLSDGLRLFDEMQENDPNLRAVVDKRIFSYTGLEWEIVSDAEFQDDVADRKVADKAATLVSERLKSITTFDDTLSHLADATATNLAVSELVWQPPHLLKLEDIPSWRLRIDPRQPGVVRVVTDENHEGVPATLPKFVVHRPIKRGQLFPLSKSLLRAQAMIYLIKQLAMVDWATFATVFGMPIRMATYDNGASDDEKTELCHMMENLGRNAWGVFSRAVNLEIKESSNRGIAPYEALINFCDRKQAILFLGGNLLSDTTGGTGTHAAGSVQDEGKDDLRSCDIRCEARMVREQIIAPMCAYLFPGQNVPLPRFRRSDPEIVDRLKEAQFFEVLSRTNVPVPRKYALGRLGVPEQKDDEPLLEMEFADINDGFREVANATALP